MFTNVNFNINVHLSGLLSNILNAECEIQGSNPTVESLCVCHKNHYKIQPCTPLLQCLSQLSLLPSTGWHNKYQLLAQ